MTKVLHGTLNTTKKPKKPRAVKDKTYPLVHVKWLDASHSTGDGWVNKETVEIPSLTAEAVGFLVFDGKNDRGEACIALATAIVFQPDDYPDFTLSFVIPKKMVLSMKRIEV